MVADLKRTRWIPANQLHAGMRIVDWHDDEGRGVFDGTVYARRVMEVYIGPNGEGHDIVEVVCPGQYVRRAFKADALVEVQQ